MILLLALAAASFPFTVSKRGVETVAEVDLRAPEGAVATVRVDGTAEHHIVAWAGPEQHTYRIFLGPLEPGKHQITVDPAPTGVRFTDDDSDVLRFAPILYERRNTAGRFSDIPLLMYCEREADSLVYTVIFSNEDGGTSTRALMARWGRTTDIEYVYRVYPKTGRAIVQGPGHKDLPFTGKREGSHPLLMPVTDNNMIAAAEESGLRFQLAPVLVDLSNSSRERVMDDNPHTYAAAARELEREGKLRPYGAVEGQKISDPRNYAVIEFRSSQTAGTAVVTSIQLRDGRIFASNLGRFDYAIERSGWARTAIELPPGATRDSIAGVSFGCLVKSPEVAGTCRLEGVGATFLTGRDYAPGEQILGSAVRPVTIPSGQAILIKP